MIKIKSEVNELGYRKETLINQRFGFFEENNKAINKAVSHDLITKGESPQMHKIRNTEEEVTIEIEEIKIIIMSTLG